MSTADIIDRLHESLAALHNDQEARIKRFDERAQYLAMARTEINRALGVIQQEINQLFDRLDHFAAEEETQAGLEDEPAKPKPIALIKGNGKIESILGGKKE